MGDRLLSIGCGEPDMDTGQMNTDGFLIPPELIQRIRRLHLGLRLSFHPHAGIIKTLATDCWGLQLRPNYARLKRITCMFDGQPARVGPSCRDQDLCTMRAGSYNKRASSPPHRQKPILFKRTSRDN
jgi:hypothetical protein